MQDTKLDTRGIYLALQAINRELVDLIADVEAGAPLDADLGFMDKVERALDNLDAALNQLSPPPWPQP